MSRGVPTPLAQLHRRLYPERQALGEGELKALIQNDQLAEMTADLAKPVAGDGDSVIDTGTDVITTDGITPTTESQDR